MKKDLIDYVIKYGGARSLLLYSEISDANPIRTKRLDFLVNAYFDIILNKYHELKEKNKNG